MFSAPFPWFGGKSRVADVVWRAFGPVTNYVEPFFGSGAVLLARPEPWAGSETVNDRDGFVANFWRALAADPEQVWQYADWPVNENDQHARHLWLVKRRETLTAKLEGDPDYFDAKVAGWWVWGICVWIGAGWCSGDGPWTDDEDGQLVHLGDAGRGAGDGSEGGLAWMLALADRLRRVRVCCGDWSRVCGPTPTVKQGLTGVLLDPPYSGEERESGLYAVDSDTVAADVRRWALEWGDDERIRIALCGYQGEHEMPGWTAYAWSTKGGYGSQGNGRGRENASREVVWFSPHCLTTSRTPLFDFATGATA